MPDEHYWNWSTTTSASDTDTVYFTNYATLDSTPLPSLQEAANAALVQQMQTIVTQSLFKPSKVMELFGIRVAPAWPAPPHPASEFPANDEE